MNLKKIVSLAVSGAMFTAGSLSALSNTTLAATVNPDSLITSVKNTSNSVLVSANSLDMHSGDIFHLYINGDAGDTVQVYFYYTDSEGNSASSIVGALGGTVLDSDGLKIVDFTAKNDVDTLTIKVVYTMSEPTFSCTIEYFSQAVTTTATTTTTARTTTTTKTTTTVPSTETTTTPTVSSKNVRAAIAKSVDFDTEKSTYNAYAKYNIFGSLDYVQEIQDSSGNIYAAVGNKDSVTIIPENSQLNTITLSKSGYTFGAAVIDDSDTLYVLWGKDLDDTSVDENNIQIGKYSLDGTLDKTLLFSSSSTSAALPFDAGNANLAYKNGRLAVLFDTEWKDGHQGAEFFTINLETNAIEAASTNVCSHSFGVSMITTEDGFVSVQRGDCYSRGIILQENTVGSKDIPSQTAYHISGYYAESGQHPNDTHILMGGVAASSSTYAVVGKSERFYASENYADYSTGVYDVFVKIVKRDSDDTTVANGIDRIDEVTGEVADTNVVWLTECNDNVKAGNVKVVSISGNRYCVLLETLVGGVFDHVSYVILDEYGNQLQSETTLMNARLSCTSIQPIVQNDVLTWAVSSASDDCISWYTLDLNNDSVGDVNLDGTVNVSDAVLLQSYLLSSAELSEYQYYAADVNGDGDVDSFDMAYIRRILLK